MNSAVFDKYMGERLVSTFGNQYVETSHFCDA